MSLLMEALRKAEEAKRQAQEADSPTQHQLDLPETVPVSPLRKKPLSQQSSLEQEYSSANTEPPITSHANDELETIAFDRPPPKASPTPPAGAAAYESERQRPAAELEKQDSPEADSSSGDAVETYLSTSPEQEDVQIQSTHRPRIKVAPDSRKRAAAAMFSAKSTGVKKAPGKTVLVLSLLLLLPLGGAGFWYFNQSSSSLVIIPGQVQPPIGFLDQVQIAPPDPAASPQAPVPANALADTLTTAETTSPANPVSPGLTTAAEDVANLPAAELPAAEPSSALDTPFNTLPDNPAIASQTATAAVVEDTEPAAGNEDPLGLPSSGSGSALTVSRSTAVPVVNPQLQSAYNQLQAGQYTRASQLYQEVLGELPNNRDALLGLASVETRMGNSSNARQLYSRLLKLNPKDPLARTGLLQTMQASNPLEQETELKALASQYPDQAPLALLLGNFYAQERRWSEAQSAYFNALLMARREDGPVSPDYTFNLAVSLEQLGQAAAAREYYLQANTLAEQSPPGFDLQLLQGRLRVLGAAAP